MKHSIKTGFSFGLTSGIITTLGLIVGLHSGTHSKLVIIGGILTIAIADALGIHVSEEFENTHTTKEIWASTISTFAAKFIFAMTFLVPVLLLPLTTAITASIIWGLSLLGFFSFYLAKEQKVPAWKVIMEHLFIALLVIGITHYVGDWVGSTLY